MSDLSSFESIGQFVLRTPLLPFAPPVALSEIARDATLREAIYVASPDLEGQLDEWLRNPDTEHGRSVQRSLLRYLMRMSGRPTPFGLFAGVSVGTIAHSTQLVVSPPSEARRFCRLDFECLSAICANFASAPDVELQLRYFPNTSLYDTDEDLRYVECFYVTGSKYPSYQLVTLAPTVELRALIARAERGATFDELIAALREQFGTSVADARAFVTELRDAQILVSEFHPAVTGDDPLSRITMLLDAAGCTTQARSLAQLIATLELLNRSRIGMGIQSYISLKNQVESVLGEPVKDHIVHVDLLKPGTPSLGRNVLGALRDAVSLLRTIGDPVSEDPWPQWRAAFAARYGTREVPLVQALDEEIGIGFCELPDPSGGSALLSDLEFPRSGEEKRTMGLRDTILLSLVTEAVRNGGREIELSDHVLARIQHKETPLPDTIAVNAVLAARSLQSLDRGDYELRIIRIDTPAARSLARFCHASRQVSDLVAACTSVEHDNCPEAVFAEVAFLPDIRTGNVLLRPILRSYEIPYLGISGAPRAKQIAASDLLVSVANDRVHLRSRSLRCAVIPCVTNAHIFSKYAPAMYRFLFAFARQDGGALTWKWGALDDLPYLPRVRHARLVLARARWLLGKTELLRFKGAGYKAVTELRDTLGWPRWIVLAEGDRELPIDLDDRLQVDSFIQRVRHRSRATIYELYPTPDTLVTTDDNQERYVHELIVPFVRRNQVRPKHDSATVTSHRRFLPGSSWFYVNLYCSVAAADHVLRSVVAPFVREALSDGTAREWFFIRYDVPDPHLRVRLFGEPDRLNRLLPRLNALLTTKAEIRVWRVQLDTYEREVERYGGDNGILLAEQLFCADSDAVIQTIEALGENATSLHWQLALRGVDRLLDDLGFDLRMKHVLVTQTAVSLEREFRVDSKFRRGIGEKFRANRHAIDEVLMAECSDGIVGRCIDALDARSVVIRSFRDRLRQLPVRVEDLGAQFLHMHVNRMMATAQRAHELVLCSLLRRHYEAKAAYSRRDSHG